MTMLNFSKYHKLTTLFSAILIAVCIVSLIVNRLKLSIDFTGGALVELKAEKEIDEDGIRGVGNEVGSEPSQVQKTSQGTYILRFGQITQENVTSLKTKLEEKTSGKVEEIRFESVGPTIGREFLEKTLIAAIIAIFAILFYVAWSFRNLTFGISAVIALLHDLIILVGSFSIFGYLFGVEIDLLFVTALLTTLSFSVHDTIVVFDRIREIKKTRSSLPIKEVCDLAFSETLVRSLNNSLTIIFMLLALVLLGGEAVKWFATALLVGTITGTYSSPFVAIPTLIFLHNFRKR